MDDFERQDKTLINNEKTGAPDKVRTRDPLITNPIALPMISGAWKATICKMQLEKAQRFQFCQHQTVK